MRFPSQQVSLDAGSQLFAAGRPLLQSFCRERTCSAARQRWRMVGSSLGIGVTLVICYFDLVAP